ncbi:hypothetical protein NDU88_004413 [Pleurodeles waltl]|uniref:Uncharacterized protein n=1 Tax=Pleurodeles waltl TaxID=8319 RepID=A0AAV7SIQ6_PLEWA|nr:hypothetical protein NDU88_004413 [Pleurodeles waltl]
MRPQCVTGCAQGASAPLAGVVSFFQSTQGLSGLNIGPQGPFRSQPGFSSSASPLAAAVSATLTMASRLLPRLHRVHLRSAHCSVYSRSRNPQPTRPSRLRGLQAHANLHRGPTAPGTSPLQSTPATAAHRSLEALASAPRGPSGVSQASPPAPHRSWPQSE